jgi:pectin methylesterase-like acyl-CoA thioesterase
VKALAALLVLLAGAVSAQPLPTMADYLAQGPSPWVPSPLADLGAVVPDFIVAADGSGTHRTVQAAVDAVPARGRSDKTWTVLIRPGSYREPLCVRDKAPLRIIGSALDPASVRVVEGRWNAQPKAADQPAHPCVPELGATTHGTAGSTSVVIASDDVLLAHFTVANDALEGARAGVGYPPGAGESGGAQAVALTTAGDRIQLENMRLLGHQDTLYVRRATPGAAARVYVRHSLVAGDVDFIFGDATLVVHRCTVLSRAGRRTPGNGGHVLAPSTAANVALGFLVIDSRFIAEPGLAPGSHSLGRAWDHGVARGAWVAGVSPNGQALVQGSVIGPHIGPWAASTSRRPFGPDHRLAETGNTR